MNEKVGTFDWIIDYDDIFEYFDAKYINIDKSIESQQLLVIGCGTFIILYYYITTMERIFDYLLYNNRYFVVIV